MAHATDLGLWHAVSAQLGTIMGNGVTESLTHSARDLGDNMLLPYFISVPFILASSYTLAQIMKRHPVQGAMLVAAEKAFRARTFPACVSLALFVLYVAVCAILTMSVSQTLNSANLPVSPVVLGLLFCMSSTFLPRLTALFTSFSTAAEVLRIVAVIAAIIVGFFRMSHQDLPVHLNVLSVTSTVTMQGLVHSAMHQIFAFGGFEGCLNSVASLPNPTVNGPKVLYRTVTAAFTLYFTLSAVALPILGSARIASLDPNLLVPTIVASTLPIPGISGVLLILQLLAFSNGVTGLLEVSGNIIVGLCEQGHIAELSMNFGAAPARALPAAATTTTTTTTTATATATATATTAIPTAWGLSALPQGHFINRFISAWAPTGRSFTVERHVSAKIITSLLLLCVLFFFRDSFMPILDSATVLFMLILCFASVVLIKLQLHDQATENEKKHDENNVNNVNNNNSNNNNIFTNFSLVKKIWIPIFQLVTAATLLVLSAVYGMITQNEIGMAVALITASAIILQLAKMSREAVLAPEHMHDE